jgi:hypothetical protein
MLEVKSTSKGLLIPRMSGAGSISNPANGLMFYNTTSNEIWYNSGTSGSPVWEAIVKDKYWTSSTPGLFYTLNPGDYVGIGLINPTYQFHVKIFDGTKTNNPILTLENNFNSGYTSMLFANSNATDYSMGVDVAEIDNSGTAGTFKIVKGSGLANSSQGDGSTMLRSFSNGITDINNQSRCRVFQQNNTFILGSDDPNGEYGQGVSYAYWTPVYYTSASYDQHGEFALMPYPLGPPLTAFPYNGGVNPPAYYFHEFTASEDGYYQVNARVDFAYVEYTAINEEQAEISPITSVPVQGGYVSIAIMKRDASGVNLMYAQGNKLMASGATNDNGDPVEQNNLAPNVSDVVYLKAGEKISIWVWQSIFTNSIPLRVRNPDCNPWVFPPDHDHPTQVYVSIHKVS